ncbi:nicotinate phosphoribosyltransferase [Coemansia sp. RSA 1086]|nr:nicotinate phosphoribosyltransferase [Coemansia sp. RSA 1086]
MTDIEEQAPVSILDQDLYKFCMQQAVLEHYPEVTVEYGFINRDLTMKFNEPAFRQLQADIAKLEHLTATDDDIRYLKQTCPFLSSGYLDFLSSFRFNPLQDITCALDSTTSMLDLRIHGKWSQVILYEIPLLSLISQAYFTKVDTDWNHDGQYEHIVAKGTQLINAGCNFAEFGTRRRRDFKTQDIVMSGLAQLPSDGPGRCTGTSNVYLARKYNFTPVGTVGHEWTMAIAALEGTYENGNSLALHKWYSTFKGNLGIALTDTFGSKAFFANFDSELAQKYVGVRHDSGDPFKFIDTVRSHYTSLGIDPSTKVVVFSDGLYPNMAIAIQNYYTTSVVQPTTYTSVKPTTVVCTEPTYLTMTECYTYTTVVPTTISHSVPTYITETDETTVTYTTVSAVTIAPLQAEVETVTLTQTLTTTRTQSTTITDLETTTDTTTHHHTNTVTDIDPTTETVVSQKCFTVTEQVTEVVTCYGTCYDTIVECCPVTVCQHEYDTCYETCTKTCVECQQITVERPVTEVVPTPVSVTETVCETVTMCQPVTVTEPVTDYDTVCQLVTVDHTATMTKPVLVVQNVCTDCPPPPPPPPPAYGYGAANPPAVYAPYAPEPAADEEPAAEAKKVRAQKKVKGLGRTNKPMPVNKA